MKSTRLLATTFAVILAGCGGSGSSGGGNQVSSTQPASTTVSGIAATGRLMNSGTPVIAMDTNGKTVTTSVDGTGHYTFDWSGLSFPILVKATEGNNSLYSVIADSTEASGSININQITHMAVVGLLGDGTTLEIETAFKAPGAAAKLTSALLHESALDALSQLPDSVVAASGLVRSSLRDIRTLSDFRVDVREDKLLDQLQPSQAGGKLVLNRLSSLPAFNDASASIRDASMLAATASPCKSTTDTTVYETKDIIVFGIQATSADKQRAALGTQRALNEIKTQLQLSIPGSGVGVDGTHKIAVCVDGGQTWSGSGHFNEFSISPLSKMPSDHVAIEWYQMLKHEMVHSVQAGLVGTANQNTVLPLWFTEGMATYMADQDIVDTVDNMNAWSTAMHGCVPTTVNSYDQQTTCPISDFGEIYRGYGAVFASLFDASAFGGAGNPLTKLRDLMRSLTSSPGVNATWTDASATAFQTAFDGLGLTSPAGGATVTLASIQTDAGWKSLVTPYFNHNTIAVNVVGASNLAGMALDADDDSGASLTFTDVIINNSGHLNVRRVTGTAALLLKIGDVAYQSPTSVQVPLSGALTVNFDRATWKQN